MSKTFTVKEVAAALGITPRGVVQRLNRDQLKGTRKQNQFGTLEWQVHATREITQAVEAMRSNTSGAPQNFFAPGAEDNYEEAIDADVQVDESYEQADWIDVERKRIEILAETLVKPLTEQLVMQAAALREKDFQLQEKDRQLRLLPDFQKEAEDRRREAEAKELEAIALSKQIEAIKVIADEKAADLARLNQLETVTLPTIQRQLDLERAQKEKDLAEAAAKVTVLENAKQEAQIAKAKLEESLQSEIARLRDEKDDQAKFMESKFDAINQKLEELQKPKVTWWQKFLGTEGEKK